MQERTVNTIRVLSADMVQKANSGHPGAPMGMAPIAHALWIKHATHDPNNPNWENRDRIVLSSGHASAMLYSVLHLCGYDYSMDDLMAFRQFGSITPGHPERDINRGVEVTTGPLGQGIANAVGMAIAETMLADKFNQPGYELVNHRTYAICGDGCLMEGISGEACSLAGTLKLSKLTVLYDANNITIEGSTDLAFTEDVAKRFESYGWNVISVDDGNDTSKVLEALKEANNSDKPTIIICPTIIGYGSKNKQGKAVAHGEPLGTEELISVKKLFGLSEESFSVENEVYSYVRDEMQKNQTKYEAWQKTLEDYSVKFPELYEQWNNWNNLNVDIDTLVNNSALSEFNKDNSATRNDSGVMINRLAEVFPNLVGGSADLAPSNKTNISDGGSYSAENRSGRNLHFGVREHAMAAICNGIAAHGGLRVFCATFLVFSDYLKAAIRMSAIMKLPVTYVLTHDSIGVGEDGETHQPVEQLAMLRSTPELLVYRPADGRETAAAWFTALSSGKPTCIALTRQNLPNTYSTSCKNALKGAYVVKDTDSPDIILIASGSEMQCIMNAEVMLKEKGINAKLVSMPSIELFLQQPHEYQQGVLNPGVKRLAIEAACTMPWYRIVGSDGVVIGIDHFGASSPASVLFKEYGITYENVFNSAIEILKQ
ncbi:MAG: transketolase [Christensenellaceae bacterium]|nr:transketolase [Christensenellaceae bacterium]